MVDEKVGDIVIEKTQLGLLDGSNGAKIVVGYE
jgi:hypothetical protein